MMSGRGGGRDLVHNIGVEPQLQIMERLGETMSAARSENLRCPMKAYVREICLLYHSKGECVKHCPRSHVPLREQIWENIIRYIRNCRAAHNPSINREFNGGSKQVSYGG